MLGGDSPLIPAARPQNASILKARIELEKLDRLVSEIDQVLVVLDGLLDTLQPPLTGKLRIEFRDQRGSLTPVIYKYRHGRNGWWQEVVKKGTASRAVRRSKKFEANSQLVKMLCREAEELMEMRRRVNAMLGRFTASSLGGTSSMRERLDALSSSLAELTAASADI